MWGDTSVPQPVPALQAHNVHAICVGTEHSMALTTEGEVLTWGSNTEGQLGLGHTRSVWEPQLVTSVTGKGIKQIAAGRGHCAAWTAPPTSRRKPGIPSHPQLGLPEQVPSQYPLLTGIPVEVLRARLRLLQHFNNLIYLSWRLLVLSPSSDKHTTPLPNNNLVMDEVSISQLVQVSHLALREGRLRPLFTPKVCTLPLVKTLSRTMIQGRNYGPQVTVRRLTAKGKIHRPIYEQIAKQVVKLKPTDLRLPSRAWKVKMLGEGADDAGGVFDDTITEMCIELESLLVPLLIPAPNDLIDNPDTKPDRFLLNPSLTSPEQLDQFCFLGILIGVAVRTKKPLNLHLAKMVWKQLAGMSLSIEDIEEVDTLYIQSLKSIEHIDMQGVDENNFHEVIPLDSFIGSSSDGRMIPIIPGGRRVALTFHNRVEYVSRAIRYRLTEMERQVGMVREGMSRIIPITLLSLLTPERLEELVCGMPSIRIDVLQSIVRYREVEVTHEVIKWLWEILEEFSNEERVLFIRFVSGRSRLPANMADITQRFQIMKVDKMSDSLPTSQTCFFQLRLPSYSSKEVMREKLRYAINHCVSIDMDNYMLTRNIDQAHLSDEDE